MPGVLEKSIRQILKSKGGGDLHANSVISQFAYDALLQKICLIFKRNIKDSQDVFENDWEDANISSIFQDCLLQ